MLIMNRKSKDERDLNAVDVLNVVVSLTVLDLTRLRRNISELVSGRGNSNLWRNRLRDSRCRVICIPYCWSVVEYTWKWTWSRSRLTRLSRVELTWLCRIILTRLRWW